jgi:hypothetical protein
MDFSGLILIPYAALITAGWTIGAALLSKRGPGFRPPFLLSYALGVLFMEPWRIASWPDMGMFVAMLVLLVVWIAAGCLIGGLPTALFVSIGSKVRHRFKH